MCLYLMPFCPDLGSWLTESLLPFPIRIISAPASCLRVGYYTWARIEPRAVVMSMVYNDGLGTDFCTPCAPPRDPPLILYWTVQLTAPFLEAAWRVGARGVVSRSLPAADLRETVVALAEGEQLWTAIQVEQINEWQATVGWHLQHLTPRQQKVACCLVIRRTNEEIAGLLSVSVKTVERTVLEEFNYRDRISFAQWAESIGWDTFCRPRLRTWPEDEGFSLYAKPSNSDTLKRKRR